MPTPKVFASRPPTSNETSRFKVQEVAIGQDAFGAWYLNILWSLDVGIWNFRSAPRHVTVHFVNVFEASGMQRVQPSA
jgi:hypothetical protein